MDYSTAAGNKPEPTQSSPPGRGMPLTAGGFAQTFGLLPSCALLVFVVDWMVFGGVIISGGALYVLCIICGFILGVITFLAQRKYYGDDSEGAIIKALCVLLLTAIPAPIPGVLAVPAGILGWMRGKK